MALLATTTLALSLVSPSARAHHAYHHANTRDTTRHITMLPAADIPTVVGANPNAGISTAFDAAYAAGALLVVGLALRSVFDSIFIENDAGDTGIYANSKISLPFNLGGTNDPVAEAEKRRIALQQAVESGDMAEALKREKELKQYMMENGIIYQFDDVEPSSPAGPPAAASESEPEQVDPP